MKPNDLVLPSWHPINWRNWLVQPIVPKGEGEVKPLSIAFPKALLTRIDRVAKETNNNRSDTIRHLLRWALDAYDNRATDFPSDNKRAAS